MHRRDPRPLLGSVSIDGSGPPRAAARPRTHLSVHRHAGIVLVPIAEVSCLVAGDKYVTVHHPGGQVLIAEALKALEQEFAPRFVRVHRAALAARDKIAALDRTRDGRYCLRLTDGMGLPVSRRHVAALRALLRSGRPAAG